MEFTEPLQNQIPKLIQRVTKKRLLFLKGLKNKLILRLIHTILDQKD